MVIYLDDLKFQLLTHIERYNNNHIWTVVSYHGFGPKPFDIFKPGFVNEALDTIL